MVAGLVLGLEPALEPTNCARQQRAARSFQDLDSLPERYRRHSAGEVPRELQLAGAEHRDAEATRSAEQLVQRRLASNRDPDERRLERDRNERRNRKSQPLAVAVDSDDADPDRVATHHLAKLVAARHADDLTELGS